MVVIAFLFLLSSFFSHCASSGFSSEQREKAREFICNCFDQLEAAQLEKGRKLRREIKRTDDIITEILDSNQIDYRRYAVYEVQQEVFEQQLREQERYRQSLVRPKEKIALWEDVREAEARALCAYMLLTDEWQQYKADPLNIQVYELLHKRMESMAKMVTRRKGHRMFVAGTHADPSQSDARVDYEVDKVFFLTLFLLNKEIYADRDGAARSSQ